jgi:hypothetical protein
MFVLIKIKGLREDSPSETPKYLSDFGASSMEQCLLSLYCHDQHCLPSTFVQSDMKFENTKCMQNQKKIIIESNDSYQWSSSGVSGLNFGVSLLNGQKSHLAQKAMHIIIQQQFKFSWIKILNRSEPLSST